MTEPPRPAVRRRLLPKLLLGALATVLLLAVIGWFALPELHRHLLLGFVGLDHNAVRLECAGKVLDAAGQPIGGARVHGTWHVRGPGSEQDCGNGSFDAVTMPDGSYWNLATFSTEVLERVAGLEAQLTLQAHGPFDDRQPSAAVQVAVPARSHIDRDFRLGALLPTVSVRVRDRSGAPVPEFWVQTLPPEGEARGGDEIWPHRYKDFPDGIAQLTVPSRRFRIEVHLYRGERTAIVGPFDPASLPEQIDVTLPDR